MAEVGTKEAKKALRMRMKALQGSQAPGEDGTVWSRLEAMPAFASAVTVLAYMSIPGEVETGAFISRWLGHKRIAVPLVRGDVLVLKQYVPGCLREGYKGIMEPTDEAPDILPEEVDLAIVPGVAFTSGGARLGRGKGFYDRLLPALGCPKIGVCYSYRMVEALPTDPWDMPLDCVIPGR